jgi:hypothetical protein
MRKKFEYFIEKHIQVTSKYKRCPVPFITGEMPTGNFPEKQGLSVESQSAPKSCKSHQCGGWQAQHLLSCFHLTKTPQELD